ncbi:hypothetical protein MMC10_000790 [Thelotrema lepadinum]|nr:hypothetical protein [Thelotrema lepadinum]
MPQTITLLVAGALAAAVTTTGQPITNSNRADVPAANASSTNTTVEPAAAAAATNQPVTVPVPAEVEEILAALADDPTAAVTVEVGNSTYSAKLGSAPGEKLVDPTGNLPPPAHVPNICCVM